MNLDEMKRIADARTKEEWRQYGNEVHVNKHENTVRIDGLVAHEKREKNAAFIAMAANNWDKLMAVVEAAKMPVGLGHASSCDNYLDGPCNCGQNQLRKALEDLEKE